MEKFLSSVLILLLLKTTWTEKQTLSCPPEYEIFPCTCGNGIFYDVIGTRVSCRDLQNPQNLKAIIEKFQGYKIHLLEFVFVTLPYLPVGLFESAWVQRIDIRDSVIEKLYPVNKYSPSPFDGLEESLEELRFIGTRDPSKWLWPNLTNLKKLKTVEFQQSPIDYVGHVFAEIGEGSLESITASYSRVHRFHPQVFLVLANLQYINFEGNYISYMSRTMFPNPALKLTFINLRYNRLETLPEDMFVNMPALKSLDLSENNLRTLPEKVYSPVWNHLHFFYIHRNPLECNCNLQWLISKMNDKTYPSNVELQQTKCSSPPGVKGLTLEYLSAKQLNC